MTLPLITASVLTAEQRAVLLAVFDADGAPFSEMVHLAVHDSSPALSPFVIVDALVALRKEALIALDAHTRQIRVTADGYAVAVTLR